MLPQFLRGPGTVLYMNEDPTFVERNTEKFPHLDPDFISQICYEHYERFDDLYPGFDVKRHAAIRTRRTAAWIAENVRYTSNEDVRPMWSWHVDVFPGKGTANFPILKHILEHLTWPFPPVIIEASLAKKLAAQHEVGTPYELVEGTHRTSYLLHLLILGRVEPTSSHELIEIVER